MKNWLAKISVWVVAVVFILSAVSKLFPVIQFEFSLAEYSIPWAMTPFFARTIIGIELVIGLLLLSGYKLRKVTIPSTVVFLLLMTGVLMVRLLRSGNEGDCGCMGQWIAMTPVQSIVKNLILLFMCTIGYRYAGVYNLFKGRMRFLFPFVFIGSLTLPYIIEPVYIGENYARKNQEARKLDVSLFYTDNQDEQPKADLNKGKHIIVFLSVGCPHCKLAAQKMGVMKKMDDKVPFYFFINGTEDKVVAFRKEQKCENIPYSRLRQPQFLQLSGPDLPAIQLIDNGMIVKDINYLDLDNAVIKDFLSQNAR